jgi:hypothetical protein
MSSRCDLSVTNAVRLRQAYTKSRCRGSSKLHPNLRSVNALQPYFRNANALLIASQRYPVLRPTCSGCLDRSLNVDLSLWLSLDVDFLLNVLLSLSCGILLRTSALLRASILAVLLAIGLALALSRSGLWCPVSSDGLLLRRAIDGIAGLDGLEFAFELTLERIDLLAETIGVASGRVWSILSVCQPLSCCEVANGMLTPYSSLQSEYSMTLSRHTSC